MNDLNEISNNHNYLKLFLNHTKNFEEVKQRINLLDYIIYKYFSIGGCRLIILVINCSIKLVRRIKTHQGMERCVSIVFRNEQNLPTAPPNTPILLRTLEPYFDEVDEEPTSTTAYPKLKSPN